MYFKFLKTIEKKLKSKDAQVKKRKKMESFIW